MKLKQVKLTFNYFIWKDLFPLGDHDVTSMMTLDKDLYISKYEPGNYVNESFKEDFCIDRSDNSQPGFVYFSIHFRHSETDQLIALMCDRCNKTGVSIFL